MKSDTLHDPSIPIYILLYYSIWSINSRFVWNSCHQLFNLSTLHFFEWKIIKLLYISLLFVSKCKYIPSSMMPFSFWQSSIFILLEMWFPFKTMCLIVCAIIDVCSSPWNFHHIVYSGIQPTLQNTIVTNVLTADFFLCSIDPIIPLSTKASSELCIPWTVYHMPKPKCRSGLCKHCRLVVIYYLSCFDISFHVYLIVCLAGEIVLQALVLTSAVVVSLTGYTFWASRKGKDFSFLGPFLFAGLTILVLTSFIQVIQPYKR